MNQSGKVFCQCAMLVICCVLAVTSLAWAAPAPNLLVNPGFELVTGSSPTGWTPDSRFTRSATVVHSGGFAGNLLATTNATVRVEQAVAGLSPGTLYTVSGWVNIPATSDVFTFVLRVRWRTGSTVIQTDTFKTLTAPTAGWIFTEASLRAPAGTTGAFLTLKAEQLNASIYVDDVAFGPAGGTTFSFQLSTPQALTLKQGASGTTSTQAALVSGTSQSVSFSASGLPAGTTLSFSLPSCIPTCLTTMTVKVGASTPSGVSTITIKGTGGGVTSLTSFTLTVGSQQQQSLVFAAAGDHQQNTKTTASLTALAASGAQFYLALGDMSYQPPGTEPSWCTYIKSHVGTAFPFELISGNHEEDGGNDGFIGNFAKCLPDHLNATGIYGAQYYFDAGGLVRVILIAPNLTVFGTSYDFTSGSSESIWLTNAINSARTAGIPWVIVGMHKVCQTMGVKNCEIGTDLINLLVSKKVDLILQGHDHNYQRSKQLALSSGCPGIPEDAFKSACVVDDGADRNYVKGAGSIIVIAGTFGQQFYTVNTNDPEAPYFAKWMGANVNPTNGFVRYTLTADQLAAEFIRSTGGTFTDSFTIHK